jgi:hypothetical protein
MMPIHPDDHLRGHLAHELGVDLLELAEEVRIASVAYGRRRAQVDYLENMRKVLLAELMETHRAHLAGEGEKVTESRLENLARTSSAYRNFLAAQRDERTRLAEEESIYFSKRNRLEAYHEMARYARAGMYLER